jgi:opacity protein-like surface antigen
MKRPIFAAVAITWPLAAWAQSPQTFYVRLDTGGSFSLNAGEDVGVDVGKSAIVGGGVGIKFLPFFRTDFTLSYRPGYSFTAPDTTLVPGTVATGNVTSLAALANAYFDFPTFAGFTPYIGGGAGVARNMVGTTTLTVPSTGAVAATLSGNTTDHFAWQAGAGVSYALLSNVAFDIGYRYYNAGQGESGTTATVTGVGTMTIPTQKGNLRANEVQFGIRVGF